MEQRFPLTWETPQDIAYRPVSTNPTNEESFSYSTNTSTSTSTRTIPDQTSSSSPQIYSNRRSTSITAPFYSLLSRLLPQQKDPKYRSIFSDGWEAGVTYSAIAAVVVLLTNIILTISASQKYGQENGIGQISEGYCKDIKRASLWLHLAINALSTVLLSASNYTMQCLSSPTRAEVDKAHARKKWLDIGVPSLRNLSRINKGKLVLWLLLGLSSVPLHLIYNSAIFSELSTYRYATRIVTEKQSQELYWTHAPNKFLGDDIQEIQRLNKRECMSAYGKQFIPDRQNLAIVVSGNKSNNLGTGSYSIFGAGYNTGLQPFSWICKSTGYPNSCSLGEALSKVDTWDISGLQVQYCLSRKMREQCRLQYSLHIMIAVIICNAAKAISMFLAVIGSKEKPLVTTGDAIASFLDDEDTTTVGMCIVTKKEINKGAWRSTEAVPGEWSPRIWKPRRAFWFSAASISRWALCNLLAITGIFTSLGLLIRSLKTWRDAGVPYSLTSFWDMGLGNVDMRAVVYKGKSGNKDLISSILLANLPQSIFSFLYLLYNSIFTCMLLVEEWDRWSRQRRALRVTSPTGAQRSTFFLHLPYKYGIPLIIGSGIMHWLISQSIFLIRVAEIDITSGDGQEAVTSLVGYSPISVILGAILGSLMLVTALINGFRRYSGGIPLAGSCSAAISAACHPGHQKTPAAVVPVMWGVVRVDSNGHVGHCSFSGEEVSPPVVGQWYSGESSGSEYTSINSGIMRGRYGAP